MTTTLSLDRPLTRPCTFMAKLYYDRSGSKAWERPQMHSQRGQGPPVPLMAACLFSKGIASPL